MTKRQWARFLTAAYLPMVVSMMGAGAIIPLIPLTARALGASVSEAAFITGLLGIGSIVGAIPAGILTERIGERQAIIWACLLDAVGIAVIMTAPNLVTLGVAVFGCGTVQAIIALARQSYLTEAFPAHRRARALSTLGGAYRTGHFFGPVCGGLLLSFYTDLWVAYAFAIVMSCLAALVTALLPELPPNASDIETREVAPLLPFFRQYARVYLTQGIGAAGLALVRACRDALLPLWSESQGLNAAEISLVFAVGAGIDMLLFYFGGHLMDKKGRRFVAVPSLAIMGVAFTLLPFATTLTTIVAVSVLLGFGNGISAGVVMTLGSDAAPVAGRARFLAGWRTLTGIGQAVGPLVITGIAAFASLTPAAWTVGTLSFASAAWMRAWLPKAPPPKPQVATETRP